MELFLLTGPNWDSSSWCVQGQQPQLPCTYTSPGGYGYVSPMSPPMPSCLPSAGQSFQRGIIRPMAKLSQKHQQLWEAQVCVLIFNCYFIISVSLLAHAY